MTFEDIAKANASIVTTDIQGKAYAEVNQRIKAFRMLYPAGYIKTEMVSNENGVCVFHAEIGYTENGESITLGTGTAYEKEGSSFINKTSYIENCETSAVGRALGMCGIGIDTSVASYEEVANAIANQGKKPAKPKDDVSADDIERLRKSLIQLGGGDVSRVVTFAELCYKDTAWEDMTFTQLANIKPKLAKAVADQKKLSSADPPEI